MADDTAVYETILTSLTMAGVPGPPLDFVRPLLRNEYELRATLETYRTLQDPAHNEKLQALEIYHASLVCCLKVWLRQVQVDIPAAAGELLESLE